MEIHIDSPSFWPVTCHIFDTDAYREWGKVGKPGELPPPPGPPRLESLRSRNGVASLRKWSRFAPGWKILHIFDGNPIGDHIMHHHMVAGAEGARHHVVRGGRRPPLIMWSPLVFLALASASFIGIGLPYFIGFGHFLFVWILPLLFYCPLVFSASL